MKSDHAQIYANQLLSNLGLKADINQVSDHPALAWRRSGLLDVTGHMLPVPLMAHLDGAMMALASLSPNEILPKNGSLLAGERARFRGLARNGRWTAGGFGRLLDTKDGRIALNLSRDEDWDLVPAWLEASVVDWDDIAKYAKTKSASALVQRGAEMGLAVSLDEYGAHPKSWFSSTCFETAEQKTAPLVVDLSGLWAGPLASSLLQMTGAQVVKVESPNRPDGMRNGHKEFYGVINGGKDCAALDFRRGKDLKRLKALLDKADIVIEASRPRALRQLGIDAQDFVARKPGKIWARITAYGRAQDRIGFGDDIGVAAGLSAIMERAYGEVCFVGDAIADPVSAVHIALAIKAFAVQGGGAVLDFSMRDIVRYAIGDIPMDLKSTAAQWQSMAEGDTAGLYTTRAPQGPVKALGADTDQWC